MIERQLRQQWMATLARAPLAALEGAVRELPEVPAYELLRRPEVGLVMVRGRAGGSGQRFNLGEMTVTRSAVRLADGTVGHGYVAGREPRRAELAALFDALLQGPGLRPLLERLLLEPLETARARERDEQSRKAAATRVEFFTLARGEDE